MRGQSVLTTGRALAGFAAGVLARAMLGAAVGLTAGLLFGLLFGAIDAALNLEVRRLGAAAPYFAVCAAAAGALTGGFSRVLDGLHSLDTEEAAVAPAGAAAPRTASIPKPLLARRRSLGSPMASPRRTSLN